MSSETAIEWTDATWNPVTGCTKVSPGCAHCYAEAITLRFHRGGPFSLGQSTVKVHLERLKLPLVWKIPRRIFVNSMSDLFHEAVPLEVILRVFSIMIEARHHTFQILTKRHERLAKLASQLSWPSNVWVGVSVENQIWADRRIPYLRQVPATTRFLSCEPLLGPLDLRCHFEGLHWVIVGGESGPKARTMDPNWARSIRDQCFEAQVPFFFKQWGGRTSKVGGRILDGNTWDQMPNILEPNIMLDVSGNKVGASSIS
ncbi:MAG: phage Gp37/Gp68 family protein [Chloroflexi bacterium]|nr:phage Gp37/Gp68 family protein [Chloroflexota bacterium]